MSKVADRSNKVSADNDQINRFLSRCERIRFAIKLSMIFDTNLGLILVCNFKCHLLIKISRGMTCDVFIMPGETPEIRDK